MAEPSHYNVPPGYLNSNSFPLLLALSVVVVLSSFLPFEFVSESTLQIESKRSKIFLVLCPVDVCRVLVMWVPGSSGVRPA